MRLQASLRPRPRRDKPPIRGQTSRARRTGFSKNSRTVARAGVARHRRSGSVDNNRLGAHTPLDVGDRLQRLHLAVYRLVGKRLQARIDGRVDDQAVGINILIVAVRPIDQPFANLRSQMRGGAEGFRLAFEIEAYRARCFADRIRPGSTRRV